MPGKPAVLLLLQAIVLAVGNPACALGFDASAVDKAVDPCADFYQYACGNWLKTHPIPPDRSAWDPYYELQEKNAALVRGILEGREPGGGGDEKVATYYAACMDEAAVEKRGLKPLRVDLRRIERIKTPADSIDVLAAVQTSGADALLSFYAAQDFRDSRRVIATLGPGSLGMTDREYYLKDGAEAEALRAEYRRHVAKMLEYSGLSAEAARAGAEAVLRIETEMARARPTREQRRDPASRYHLLTRAQLNEIAPGWPWRKYFTALEAPPIVYVNVTAPDSLRAVTRLWLALPAADQRAYLRWHLINALAEALPAKPAAEDFRFYGTVLRGAKEMPPRWKRCASLANESLGEAVGKAFVAAYFPAERKQRVLAQVRAIEAALHDEIATLPWMSDATRQEALRKLEAFRLEVGYTDHWRDYSRLDIRAADALGNLLRARRFEFARRAATIGKPVDLDEWFSLPQDVDGYQNGALVELVLTAGILQPPFYDPTKDDAVNFGAIGRAIGHEFIHGFDDEGRKFDQSGDLRDWWTPEDAARFQKDAQCIADEYSQFAVVGKKLNGQLTLGENLADNGGTRLAYVALERQLAGRSRAPIDGLAPEQRFFLSFAQTQCSNVADAAARNRLLTDPHSPGRWRVNGTLQNMPQFQKAFSCGPDSPMVSRRPCRVW